jgi:DNA polymerase-3 subunit chi
MATAVFYHLIHAGLEDTLRMILTRAVAQGWRVFLRGVDAKALERLDERLWLGPEDGFLPHGLAGGPHDALQPVLLGTGAIGNGAQGLVLVEGAEVSVEEARPLERVWVLFDGADAAQVQFARGLWTRLTGAGMAAQYWSDEGGAWVKKTERSAAG